MVQIELMLGSPHGEIQRVTRTYSSFRDPKVQTKIFMSTVQKLLFSVYDKQAVMKDDTMG
jgi:hypothetical protein